MYLLFKKSTEIDSMEAEMACAPRKIRLPWFIREIFPWLWASIIEVMLQNTDAFLKFHGDCFTVSWFWEEEHKIIFSIQISHFRILRNLLVEASTKEQTMVTCTCCGTWSILMVSFQIWVRMKKQSLLKAAWILLIGWNFSWVLVPNMNNP